MTGIEMVSISSGINSKAELNSSLLRCIECPCCLNYMTSSIFVCENGHSFCSNCRLRLAKCPKCFRGLTNTRNYDLEGVAETLEYPCDYDGCAKMCSLNELPLHRTICNFRTRRCCIQEDEEMCDWEGPYIKLADHARKVHAAKAWMRESSDDTWKETMWPSYQTQFIFAYGEIFYLHQKQINQGYSNSILYWAVEYVGLPSKAEDFGYSIAICGTDENSRSIRVEEVCMSEEADFEQETNEGTCIGLPVTILNSYKNRYGRVSFKLEINHLV